MGFSTTACALGASLGFIGSGGGACLYVARRCASEEGINWRWIKPAIGIVAIGTVTGALLAVSLTSEVSKRFFTMLHIL